MKAYGRPPKQYKKKNDEFVLVKVYLPRKTYDILRQTSIETGKALSRLCAISVDNELDTEKPFNYPVTLDGALEAGTGTYQMQAIKILSYLKKFDGGTTKETLMLCRRDIGVESKDLLIKGISELLVNDVIEEFEAKHSKYFPGDRMKLRPVTQARVENETRHRRPESLEEIE